MHRLASFFCTATATTEIYTLSLHDALPISHSRILTRCWSRNLRTLGNSSGIRDRKSTRLNSSHVRISYAVFCLKKKKSKRNKPGNGLSHHVIQFNDLADRVPAGSSDYQTDV